MYRLVSIVFLTLIMLLFAPSAKATFVCDDLIGAGDCEPVSQVPCNALPPTQVNSCPGNSGSYWNVASCDAFDHQEGLFNYYKRYYYRIRKNASTNICGSPGWAYSHEWSQTSSANTDVQPGSCAAYANTNVPPGCNTGIQPPGGQPPNPTTPPDCPPQYPQPINCDIIPCAHKNICGCECLNPPCSALECSGGFPPTATPSPTPTPFCRLFCPGQGPLLGQLDEQGGGVGNAEYQPTPILPTQAVGFLEYRGYNNFQCTTFDDAKTYPRNCPAGTIGDGNLTGLWTYPTPTTNPLRYNMLCGNQTHIYTAIVNSGQRSDGYISGPTPVPGLYPPGCVIGTPTPTPEGGIPNIADQDAAFLRGQGGVIVSDTNSCSCSVAVGCQTSLQALPSETGENCIPECDFTVNPQTPELGDSVTFTPSGSGVDSSSRFSFDDNSPDVSGASQTAHTFANSGVYRVSLSCPAIGKTCTRVVNNYCGPLSWYKIKDASFHKNGTLNDPIPSVVNAFDAEDTTESLVSIGTAGLVTTNGTILTGSGNLSTINWRTTAYTPSNTFSPTSYADYLISRKSYTTIVDENSNSVIDSNELTENSINYIVGNYTIDNNSVQSKAPVVIVVRGDLTINIINNDEFNPPDKAITIIATGTLKIHSHQDTLNGIFIATSVDIAYDVQSTDNPLKVVGNLISQNSIDLKKRVRTDGTKPSLFVIQNYEHYLKVLDKLGIRKYTQTELRP